MKKILYILIFLSSLFIQSQGLVELHNQRQQQLNNTGWTFASATDSGNTFNLGAYDRGMGGVCMEYLWGYPV